jgi:hypothetical protein
MPQKARHTEDGKICKRCEEFKALDQFQKRAKHSLNSYQPFCKPCQNEYKAEWRKATGNLAVENKKRRTQIQEYRNQRYKEDATYRLVTLCRSRMRCALSRARAGKQGKRTLEWLGCTGEFLHEHLKQQLPEGASWADYHVDHIRPIASYDLSDPQQMQECFNWRNLQLLTVSENIAKGSKW